MYGCPLRDGRASWPAAIGRSGYRRSGGLLGAHVLGLLDRLVDAADHVERLLRQMVDVAVDDHLEAADGFLQRHVLARRTGKHFGHVGRLREEALALAR